MRFLSLLIFLLCFYSNILAENASLPYLTSENDTLSLVDGIVDVYNGKLVQIDKDIEIHGSHPFELLRYYDGGHHFASDLGYSIGHSFPILLTFEYGSKKHNLRVEHRIGFELPCTVVKKKSSEFLYSGTIDKEFFQNGYSNSCEALLRGEPSLRSLIVQGDDSQFTVTLGDGTKRIYSYFFYASPRSFFRLIREDFPNGNHRFFSYSKDQQPTLKRVWTTNPNMDLVLNWLNFTYKKDLIQIDASNGQSVFYHLKIKKGEVKNSSYLSSSSTIYHEKILEKVTGKHLLECQYETSNKSNSPFTIFCTKLVSRPEGRFIKVDYNEKKQVKKLWASGSNHPLYQFEYKGNHTKVTDANGGIRRFFFYGRRLVKLEEPYQIQHFSWDEFGQLDKYFITDTNIKVILGKEYQYNDRGYVVEAKVFGTIKESGRNDGYSIKYSYSEDARNLLLNEEHPENYAIKYTYVPNTNLISSKLHVSNQGVVEREFYQYDVNGILTGIVCDDGNGEVSNDYTNVTCRKFTEITPQLDIKEPGLTLPKIVTTGYEDVTTGIRHNHKSIEKIYGCGDLLVEEKISDANGNYCYSLYYEYNDRRELISETDPMGVRTIYRYDSNGNIISEEKIGGEKVDYVYNTANHLIKEIEYLDDGKSLTTSHVYDPIGNRIETTDFYNQKSRFQFDLASRETLAIDSLGFKIQKELDPLGNVTLQIDQDGYSTKTIYNINGDPLEIQYPDGTQKLFKYNLRGHLIYEREKDGLINRYEVDYQGRIKVAETFSSEGKYLKTIRKFYKGPSLILEIDAMGNQILYSYDFAGRLISKKHDTYETRLEYDSLGRVSKTIESERITVKEYDFSDRVIEERIEDYDGTIYQKLLYTYDINGNCISRKEYIGKDTFAEATTQFNKKNQPILEIDPCGNLTFISYCYTNHLEKTTLDALGRKSVEIYDPLQRLKEVSRYSPVGTLVARHCLEYNGLGNLIALKEDILCEGKYLGSYVYTTTYDSVGQKTSETEQNIKTTRYNHQLGRLHEIIYPDGIILSHEYDDLGRLSTLSSSDRTIQYQYTYDLNDNLLSVEDHINQTLTSRSYDVFNRLIFEKQANGFEIAYSYDPSDRLTEVCFNNYKLSYEHNPMSLVSAKCFRDNELRFQYDQSTDLRGMVINSQFLDNSKIIYTWDSLGRCLSIESALYSQLNSYNSVGNITDITIRDPLGSYPITYTYDDLDQLTSERGFFQNQYLFDSINNLRNKDNVPNSISNINQIIETNSQKYCYDLNGRRISKGDEIYSYSALGRLTKVTKGNHSIDFLYDPFGRLIARSVDGTKTQYLYQFDTEIASFESQQMTAFRALYGAHASFGQEVDGVQYTPLCNHRGDLCLLLGNGNPVSTYRYNAFGEFIHDGEVASPWLFSGQRYNEDLGIYHYAKREYDPSLGVWLTPDPLGFADGPNLYAYVNNNPLLYTDPYGLWREHFAEIGRCIREYTSSVPRGCIDDTTWDTASYALGEYKPTSYSAGAGYYTGRGISLGLGLVYGGTELKIAMRGAKVCSSAYRNVKAAFNVTKGNKVVKETRKISVLAKGSELSVEKTHAAVLKTPLGKAERDAYFKNVELELDKQNKHVVGKHNYKPGKSIFEHEHPELILKENAGRGIYQSGEICKPGYKEVVDFKTHIGIYKDTTGLVGKRTTRGIIHYSKKGAHIVPAAPNP